ncbi:hypothetical protein Barb6XT_01134 [Bacteroidales bacterium Barb6XT]|nr:hypothetical protein Barb4_02426 [Bacteroidales bacterium Barb4]OAV68171.1 hypothetical protein Barb6XT_01134 [Bacteroidales bacterium Barb6XT]
MLHKFRRNGGFQPNVKRSGTLGLEDTYPIKSCKDDSICIVLSELP